MGDLSDFSKRKDCWCVFSRSICNQDGHCIRCTQNTSFQGFDGIHRSWENIISYGEQRLKTKAKCKGSPFIQTIMSKNHRTIAAKVTPELNIHLEDPVSTKMVRWQLRKSSIHSRAASVKLLITANSAKRQRGQCDDHKTWKSDDQKYVIWLDESSFTLFPTSGQVNVWKTPKEAYISECLVPNVKYGSRSVMIWAVISLYSAGSIITLSGRITASDQVYPLVQKVFPNNSSRWEFVNTRSQKCSVFVSGAWICTPASSLASTLTRLKYHWTTVVSFREQGEKQTSSSIISQATRRCLRNLKIVCLPNASGTETSCSSCNVSLPFSPSSTQNFIIKTCDK